MYKFLQHLGRSLMLPVAVLPAAAIIVGIGHTLDALNILPQAALFFTSVGITILEQLGILFAIGVVKRIYLWPYHSSVGNDLFQS